MPRKAKGSPWRASRTARAPALSATMVPLDDGEHARERYHRPGRTLRQLVVDLVERLFQREEIEQRIDHARLFRHRAPARHGRAIARHESLGHLATPLLGTLLQHRQ